MTRVLHLCKSLNRGGAEVLLAEMVRARPRSGVSVGYLLQGADAVAVQLRDLGATTTCFGASSSVGVLATATDVARHLVRERIDLVHAHLPLAGVVARVAGRLAGVPVVYSEHNRFDSYHPATQVAALATWPLQQRVVAVSADVAAAVPVVGVPVDVVRNGIATHRFVHDAQQRRVARAGVGFADDAIVIGAACVFRTAKRLDRWLDVVAAAHRAEPRVKGLLVGYGPLADEVHRWRATRGLEDVVVLPGIQQDVRPWLQAMDVFLMTSAWEGLPVAALEAMATGLPVVATDVGGVREAIDGTVGALVAESETTTADITGALLELVRDSSRRKSAGRAARVRVERDFSIERMLAELDAVYARAFA
jgi:glycosyltransferase involved in cell wall biosynthesis